MAYLNTYDFSDLVGFTPMCPSNSTPSINVYSSLVKKKDYLYEVTYDSLDYDYAKKYFESGALPLVGGCSAKRQGNFVGRNYDWMYDNTPSFIVRTPNCQGHYAVIGTAACLSKLSKDVVESRAYSDYYKILPFYLLDGINEKGLMIEDNVVPSLHTKKTTPLVEKRERIASMMLLRYMLDNFATVDEAVDYVKNYIEIYFPSVFAVTGYELHYMLSDTTKSVVMEIVDNKVEIIESNINTNFHIYGVDFNEDGSVYTNYTVKDGLLPSSQGIEPHGDGLERWNILNAADATDKESMRTAMDNVIYSQSYTNPIGESYWYSEFVGLSLDGKIDITVDTPHDDPEFVSRIEKYKKLWEIRTRENPMVWITCHSCIYDLENKTYTIVVQEEPDEFNIMISNSSIADLEERIKKLESLHN